MKLGIMQPYFFPYLGYFQLIEQCDVFVLLEDVQYIRHGWVNRNKIFAANQDSWQYIVAPLKKHSREALISEIFISSDIPWREKLRNQLSVYNKSRFRKDLEDFMAGFFVEDLEVGNAPSLARLNFETLVSSCTYLNIDTKIRRSSDLTLDYSAVTHPGDWAFEISRQLGASTYINPIGGRSIFDESKFRSANIKLQFLRPPDLKSIASRGLSILDDVAATGREYVYSRLNEVTFE